MVVLQVNTAMQLLKFFVLTVVNETGGIYDWHKRALKTVKSTQHTVV